MRFHHALENARLILKVLATALIFFFISNIFLIIGWMRAQSAIDVNIPPQIPVSGITLKEGSYPLATVYSFAFYIWQGVNHWPSNGADDYQKNIEQFSPYLTPRFKSFLIRDYNNRFNQGEIQDRIRMLEGENGSAFEITDVEAIGHDTWLVHLHMRLTEYMAMNGNVVKDAAIDYVLRVVRENANAKQNLWGLALDGFAVDPKRIKTFT